MSPAAARKRLLLVSLDANQTLMSQQADDSILFWVVKDVV
jgi:hypothetical protein